MVNAKNVFIGSVMLVCGILALYSEGTKETTAVGPEGGAESNLVFGYIAYDLDDMWNYYSLENFKYIADKNNVNTVVYETNGEQSRAVSSMKKLIDSKVDGISVFTPNSTLGGELANMAGDANIPVTFENLKPEGEDITYQTACWWDFTDMGRNIGNFIKEEYPNAKVFFLKGKDGEITSAYERGLRSVLQNNSSVSYVGSASASWRAQDAKKVLEEILDEDTSLPEKKSENEKEETEAGTETEAKAGEGEKEPAEDEMELQFDVLLVNNEHMAIGALSALKEAEVFEFVDVIVIGGSQIGLKMLEEKEISTLISVPVSLQSMVSFQILFNTVMKRKSYSNKNITLPIFPLQYEDIEAAITWEPGETVYDYTINFLVRQGMH